MKTILFQHTFQDGIVITLSIHRRKGQTPLFTSDRHKLHKIHEPEYQAWREEVFNELYEHLDEDEILACAIYGQQV